MISEAERVQIRKYLGLASMQLTGYARFETAITLIQARSEGGQMVDNSTELAVRAALAELVLIETALKDLRGEAQVLEMGLDKMRIDPVRGAFFLRQEGRRHIAYLATVIGLETDGDYFTGYMRPASVSNYR